MGYFYSLGISFDNENIAQECISEFKRTEIKLSDSTCLECHSEISKSIYLDNVPQQYICCFHPNGMGDLNTEIKLFTRPYFYEIQKAFYSFLYSLKLPFNYALWEAEGADRIISDDLATYLKRYGYDKHYGFGKDEIGDPNASHFSGFEASYFEDKRYLDGLIMSEKKYSMIKEQFKEFEIFKDGYFWLPINKEIKN